MNAHMYVSCFNISRSMPLDYKAEVKCDDLVPTETTQIYRTCSDGGEEGYNLEFLKTLIKIFFLKIHNS